MTDVSQEVRTGKRLIINADDFGLTRGVTAGILAAMFKGVVSSTTAMMCKPGTPADLREWSPRLAGRIGVHLQLTDGIPCSDAALIPSLLNGNGLFPRLRRDLKDLNPDEVRREWHAQVERFLDHGLKPSHIDSHHHVHKNPVAFEIYCEIAKFYGVPARSMDPQMSRKMSVQGIACAEYCETSWHNFAQTPRSLINQLNRDFDLYADPGVLELMCHPALVDEELASCSSYVEGRETELQLLCSPELLKLLRESEIEVISPSALAGRQLGQAVSI